MRAIQLQPDFAAAYLNLGGLQEELGDMAAAERSFRTRAREAAGLSRCRMPGWRRCCARSCPKRTWRPSKSG